MGGNLIKRIPIKILVSDFIITFSYETKKGYYREQQRSMFNVKILGIVETENKEIIEL